MKSSDDVLCRLAAEVALIVEPLDYGVSVVPQETYRGSSVVSTPDMVMDRGPALAPRPAALRSSGPYVERIWRRMSEDTPAGVFDQLNEGSSEYWRGSSDNPNCCQLIRTCVCLRTSVGRSSFKPVYAVQQPCAFRADSYAV